MSDITLYFSRASRAFTPRWLLEEIGVAYRVEAIDLRMGEQKSAEYLKINPMGKVPALTDGDIVVSENPAICIYLSDRYASGTLAPDLRDSRRGSFLRWMIFSTAVFEPSIYLADDDNPAAASGRGWGDRSTVLSILDQAFTDRQWLLGDEFSAADVMLGSLIVIALFNNRIPERPLSLVSYGDRLADRPAYKRATEATWGG